MWPKSKWVKKRLSNNAKRLARRDNFGDPCWFPEWMKPQ